jgi:DNA-directed RNA polymerase specialized sigma24 family protein
MPEAPQAPVDRDLTELVRRALVLPQGEGNSRAKLCDRLLPLFQSIAAKLCYRFRGLTRETIRQESLDIVQHVCCSFLEDLNHQEGVVARWRAEQGPLEAWLRPFATCRALDHLRKRKRPLSQLLHPESLQTALEEDLLSLHVGMTNASVQLEQRDALKKLCQLIVSDPELGPDTLKLLERLFWYEEDRELLAASLGLKRNTLDVRLKRIREHLVKLAQQVGLPFGITRDSNTPKKR